MKYVKKYTVIIILFLVFLYLFNISGGSYTKDKLGWTVSPKIFLYNDEVKGLPLPCPTVIGPGASEPIFKGYPLTMFEWPPCGGGDNNIYPIGVIIDLGIFVGLYFLIKRFLKF